MLVVVLLVLAFFFVFLSQLEAIFPASAGLKALFNREELFGAATTRQSEVRLGGDIDLNQGGELTAVLATARNSVKTKRAAGIAWAPAQIGMPLYEQDAVQTFGQSSARIVFDDNNYLNMGSDSLVVIRRFERDPFRKEKRSLLLMVDGELEGSLKGSKEENVFVQVATPSAVARIQSGPQDEGGADFKITINDDQSSTINVYNGNAEIVTADQSIVVEENQSIRVGIDGFLAAPQTLPDAPSLEGPAHSEVFYYRDLPPLIRFAWQPVIEADRFHFILARDRRFAEIVSDEVVDKPGFSHGNLQPGKYYWRVSSIVDRTEGRLSSTGQFSVVQDSAAPTLTVDFPYKNSASERYTVTGNTEAETHVFIDGEEIEIASDGRFSHTLTLQRGANVIVVEAVDAAGNISYESEIVNGKF